MMPARIPGSLLNINIALGAVQVEVFINKNRPNLRLVAPHPFQQRLVENTPKITFAIDVAEPAAVVAVRAGRHQRWKIAVASALMHLPHEPASVHSRFL